MHEYEVAPVAKAATRYINKVCTGRFQMEVNANRCGVHVADMRVRNTSFSVSSKCNVLKRLNQWKWRKSQLGKSSMQSLLLKYKKYQYVVV